MQGLKEQTPQAGKDVCPFGMFIVRYKSVRRK